MSEVKAAQFYTVIRGRPSRRGASSGKVLNREGGNQLRVRLAGAEMSRNPRADQIRAVVCHAAVAATSTCLYVNSKHPARERRAWRLFLPVFTI